MFEAAELGASGGMKRCKVLLRQLSPDPTSLITFSPLDPDGGS